MQGLVKKKKRMRSPRHKHEWSTDAATYRIARQQCRCGAKRQVENPAYTKLSPGRKQFFNGLHKRGLIK
jgi:hypothetical protein